MDYFYQNPLGFRIDFLAVQFNQGAYAHKPSTFVKARSNSKLSSLFIIYAWRRYEWQQLTPVHKEFDNDFDYDRINKVHNNSCQSSCWFQYSSSWVLLSLDKMRKRKRDYWITVKYPIKYNSQIKARNFQYRVRKRRPNMRGSQRIKRNLGVRKGFWQKRHR